MGVVYHNDWDLSDKGKKDAERHREKIDDAIRKNVRDVIGEESIITKRGKKKIRVPVKGLKDYRFVHGDDDGPKAGAGQGDGKPGDIIGRRPSQGDGKGDGKGGKGDEAGDQPGEDYMETEVDIDYLLQIMFEDLGLPWIEEKTTSKKLVPKGWRFETISKKGIMPRLHKKRTMMETVKRNIMLAASIMEETGCNEETAYKALNQTFCDINDAIKLIETDQVDMTASSDIVINNDDLRFKQIEEDVEYHSNAVIIAMMDVSYSMGPEKKYLCRSLLFWLTEFLKKKYNYVDIKFIQHTTEAVVVDEDTFFHRGTTGGTYCYTAFEKANYMIETEYPLSEWNVYCIYVGDGEDFDTEKTTRQINDMLDKQINMLGYVEIDLEADEDAGYRDNARTLLNAIKRKWKFKHYSDKSTDFYKNESKRFLCSVIRNKGHVWPTLKHMLFEREK